MPIDCFFFLSRLRFFHVWTWRRYTTLLFHSKPDLPRSGRYSKDRENGGKRRNFPGITAEDAVYV